MTYEVLINGKPHRVELAQEHSQWRGTVDGRSVSVDAVLVRPGVLSLILDGISYEVKRENTAGQERPAETQLWVGDRVYLALVRDRRSLQSHRASGSAAEGTKTIIAPMPGKVVRILVQEGDQVQAGQGVAVVEAMKMQNELKSPKQGAVQKVVAAEGDSVNAGDALLVIE